MEIKEVNVNDLIPYEFNNKIHNKEQVNRIANSIKEFGFLQPLVIDKNNILIVGHGRLEGAKKLGLKTVPCVYADNLTEQQIKKYRILDNKLNESERDIENLKLELDELPDLNIGELELEVKDLFPELVDQEEEKEVVEDEAPEVQKEAKMVRGGDLFLLGKHRLLCGDSTNDEDVEILMDGQKADLVFTDPPYNLETKGGCKGEIGKALRKQGKDIEFISNFNPEDFLNILPSIFDINKLNAYVFCNKELLPTYLNWAVDNNYSYNVLVWKKPSAIPIGDSHRPDIEYLLLFRRNAIWNNGLKDVNYSRCLEFSRETGLHPTMKPIHLITNEMKISSNKNSNVLDLFGGSGSTMIACEQLGRNCFMMELDPKYIEVIIKRFHNINPGAEIKCLNRDLDLNQLRDEDK